jgi:hypothetical protein
LSVIPCPTEAKSPASLVDVLRRFLPIEYLQPMEPPRAGAPGAPGWETILAASQAMSRVSVAAERLGCGLFFLTAPSGVLSTATVRLTRSSTTTGTAGVVIVKAGSIIMGTHGRLFVVREDSTFGATDLSIDVVVDSTVQAYWLNTDAPAPTTVPMDTTWAIGQLVLDPPYADTTITVAKVDAAHDGTTPFLELLGNDRGLIQYPGESDESFRLRCRTLPDTVTPGAIERMLARVFTSPTQSYEYHDLWALDFQTAYDMPLNTAPVVFVYDDTRPFPPSRNRYLPPNYLKAFVISLADSAGPINDATYGSFTDQLAAIKAAGVGVGVLWES